MGCVHGRKEVVTIFVGELATDEHGPVVGRCVVALVLIQPLRGDDFHLRHARHLRVDAPMFKELNLGLARRAGELAVKPRSAGREKSKSPSR